MISTAHLKLYRTTFTRNSTIGELWTTEPGKERMLAFVLEDVARPYGVKVPGKTCIWVGKYKIKITYSNRFKRPLPIIYNQEDLSVKSDKAIWTGVRIHPGNTAEDTEGCLLPGLVKMEDKVAQSRAAFDDIVLPYIVNHPDMKKNGYITLEIINKPQP